MVLGIWVRENESAKFWLGVFNDLKTIYTAKNEGAGYERLQEVKDKWKEKYSNTLKE